MDQEKLEITQKTAERIKRLRTEKGISREHLANTAGLNSSYLGMIERSLKCPTVDTLNKIAAALGIPLAELLTFEVPDEDKNAVIRKAVAIETITKLMNYFTLQEAEQFAELMKYIVKLKKDGI